MINFTRAFDSAWERMMVILFRPFVFEKWCAIGLSAFLAGLLQGGNGFNSYFNNLNNNQHFQRHTFWQASPPGGLTHDVAQAAANATDSPWHYLAGFNPQQLDLNLWGFNPPSLATGFFIFLSSLSVLFLVMAVIFALGLVLLLYWLGARGQFLFIDNVVRNRGAISWPWNYYARQANSLFLFYLLFLLIVIITIVPVVIVAVLVAIPLFHQSHWPVGGEIAVLVILGLLYLAVIIIFSVMFFIFREFGVPLMFRNGLMARDAFVKSMRLIMDYPGSIAVFVLLRIAIFIGVAIISIIACCLTCCVALLPYIGTVILLPALVFVRCFSLDCLAQFGPEYDVWAVDVPPVSPQPPLG